MPKLLVIESAIEDDASKTRALAGVFVDAWRSRGPEFEVVTRDLAADPLPHLTQRAQHWPERLRGEAKLDPSVDELQQQLIDELVSADALLIGAPMYNYSMAATLKTWIDLIHVPGVTTPFDISTQPLAGRPAVIITAQGAPTEERTSEFVTGPLREIFGEALGMEVSVVGVARTLADMVPELGVEEANAEFAWAEAEARRLATALPGS